MTNAETKQQKAVARLENNELNSYEAEFIEEIKDFSKKELKKLTYKQYKLLEKIADNE